MRIQNNVTAMNTHRMYTMNNDAVAASAKKLSSGYRINSAADDAAGLAISEKMRSQIRGLNMATKNSQDAISLVQTAEGALQETQNMLQRMNELAVQAATGTNEDLDRTALAKEFEQLKREINDVAEQTNFNNMKILDGSLSYKGYVRSAATAGVNMTVETLSNAPSSSIDVETTAATPGTAGVQASNLFATALKAQATTDKMNHSLQLKLGDQTVTLQGANGDFVFGGLGVSANKVSDALTAANAPSSLTATLKIDGKDVDVEFLTADAADGTKAYTLRTLDKTDVDLSNVQLQLTTITPDTGVETGSATPISADAGKAVTGVSPVAAAANTTATTEIKIDQNKLQNGDSVKIGNKTYTFYAKGAKDDSGKEIKSGASGNDVTIVYDPDEKGSAAKLLADAINGGFTGAETGATAVSGSAITAEAGATLGTPAAKAVGDKVTVTASYTAADTSASGGDYVKDDYDTDVTNAEAANKTVAAEANTAGTKDSKQTTMEFDVAKMKDGDTFNIKIGNQNVSVTFNNGDTRKGFMEKVQKAVANLGEGVEVKGNALLVKDKDVSVELDSKWEKEDYASQTNAIRIQVGALENEQLAVSIDSMNTASLGLDNSFLALTGNSNDQNIDLAGAAITATRNAINKVSDQRATLGAMQNRLDHKIANLKTTAENLTASESRIRDVDMAQEMTNFTKNNILSQAATAMLAQANSLPQNVLSLLG